MSCNCKASQYIRQTKKKFGYEPESIKNISGKEKIKMGVQAIIIWIMMIVGVPFIFLWGIFGKIFLKKKKFKLFNAISIKF